MAASDLGSFPMIGQTLGPYRVLEKLGAGGMGVVYRAHDERLDRDVALRMLPAEVLGDETARARVVRQARLAFTLNHPYIRTIYKDPSYAATCEGLAWVWVVRRQMGMTLPQVAGPKAKAAALKALELDSFNALSHGMCAWVLTYQRRFAVRDPNMIYIGQPLYDPLRADPRFQALVRRLGLPQ